MIAFEVGKRVPPPFDRMPPNVPIFTVMRDGSCYLSVCYDGMTDNESLGLRNAAVEWRYTVSGSSWTGYIKIGEQIFECPFDMRLATSIPNPNQACTILGISAPEMTLKALRMVTPPTAFLNSLAGAINAYDIAPGGYNFILPVGSLEANWARARACAAGAAPTDEALISAFLTPPEVAEILGYSPNYVANMCQAGKFVGAFKRGYMWLIPRESVETYPGRQRKKKG